MNSICCTTILQVNAGCISKKLLYYAATHAEELPDLPDYGFSKMSDAAAPYSFDWAKLKAKMEDYVAGLNSIYRDKLLRSKVELINGTAKFVGEY